MNDAAAIVNKCTGDGVDAITSVAAEYTRAAQAAGKSGKLLGRSFALIRGNAVRAELRESLSRVARPLKGADPRRMNLQTAEVFYILRDASSNSETKCGGLRWSGGNFS